MKYNQIFEIRIRYKNTTPTFIYTMNDTDMTWDKAKEVANRILTDKFEDKSNIENVHIICYDLVPAKVVEFPPDMNNNCLIIKYIKV